MRYVGGGIGHVLMDHSSPGTSSINGTPDTSTEDNVFIPPPEGSPANSEDEEDGGVSDSEDEPASSSESE